MNCESPASVTAQQFQFVRPRFLRAGFLAAVSLGALAIVSAPAQNRVLELDGNGSYVELPPNIFRDLPEATVEVWAKWDRLNSYSRVFEFGAAWNSMSLFNHDTTADLRFNLYPRWAKDNSALTFNARANGVLRSNEWIHLATVCGPGGMKLYANGEVIALHTNEAGLASIKAEQINLLGRGLARSPHDRDFRGQIDELRVWNYRRTADQIRGDMSRRLSGREEGLVGLWNFDDGQVTDASPRANHGKLVGNARVVTPSMPAGLQLIAAELVAAPVAATAPIANAAPAPAASRDMLFWWIAGALTLIAALLAWLALQLKRSSAGAAKLALAAPAMPAVNVAVQPASDGSAAPEMKERALAELTEFAKQSLVQGLYSQRNALLETQQKAHRELAELEARLGALKLPDRILAYEKRIMELERELDQRTGEVRELTSTTLSLLRRKVAEERELERATRSFN